MTKFIKSYNFKYYLSTYYGLYYDTNNNYSLQKYNLHNQIA